VQKKDRKNDTSCPVNYFIFEPEYLQTDPLLSQCSIPQIQLPHEKLSEFHLITQHDLGYYPVKGREKIFSFLLFDPGLLVEEPEAVLDLRDAGRDPRRHLVACGGVLE